MSYYLRPANVTADGDILAPSVEYVGAQAHRNAKGYLIHHVAVNDEGAGTPLADMFGGLFVPIAAKIISISAASPAVFTTDIAHGLVNGTRIFISGIDGGLTGGDQSGVVAGATATTFDIGVNNPGAEGTMGRIHTVERIIKLVNFGATLLGGGDGVGPYIGVYVDTNADNRVNILYHDM